MERRPRMRDVLLVTRMVALRALLPVLERVTTTSRLARVLATPRAHRRDPVRERLVLAIARRLWRRASAPCLERSLAVFSELGRAGASPLLVLAVGRNGENFVGHAWVEIDGRPLLESRDPRATYTSLVAFGADGRRVAHQP